MDKSILKLIEGDEANELFRLSVELKEGFFNLVIFKNPNAWAASVEHTSIYSQAKEFEIDAHEYVTKVCNYLRDTPSNVNLKFKDSSFVIYCILKNNMKVKYFTYKLEKVDFSIYMEMLMNKFYIEWSHTVERLCAVEKEKYELGKSNKQFQSKLKEFIDRQNQDDEELFSSFVLVMNEKKRRIQHLNEMIHALKKGRSSVNPPVKEKKYSKKLKTDTIECQKSMINSDSEEYDTDDEKLKKCKNISREDLKNENKNDVYVTASTSKINLLADDSPPRHIPKRVKSESSVRKDSNVEPSTSKQTDINKEANTKSNYVDSDGTPNVNFSTQELLDNL